MFCFLSVKPDRINKFVPSMNAYLLEFVYIYTLREILCLFNILQRELTIRGVLKLGHQRINDFLLELASSVGV